MFLRLTALTLVLVQVSCSDDGSSSDGRVVDFGMPDTPLVKLDQKPLPFEAGSDTWLPDHGLPDAGRPATLKAPFFMDFEHDNGQLIGTRDWEWGLLAFQPGSNCDNTSYTPPTAGHSGTGMWGTKLNDCYTGLDNAKEPCTNAVLVDDSVLSFQVEIPGTLPNPRLTYWEWADYFLSFDWTEVRIDNKVVSQVCKSGSLSSPPKWEKRSLDLKSYAGKTVTVAFHFMASGVVNYSGWYIDDLAVNSD